MKKYVCYTFIFLLGFSATALCQTKEVIQKSITDPKAAENSAKADVRLIDRKKITDDSLLVTKPKAAPKKKCFLRKKRKTS